jgi:hypothetical protein
MPSILGTEQLAYRVKSRFVFNVGLWGCRVAGSTDIEDVLDCDGSVFASF